MERKQHIKIRMERKHDIKFILKIYIINIYIYIYIYILCKELRYILFSIWNSHIKQHNRKILFIKYKL